MCMACIITDERFLNIASLNNITQNISVGQTWHEWFVVSYVIKLTAASTIRGDEDKLLTNGIIMLTYNAFYYKK